MAVNMSSSTATSSSNNSKLWVCERSPKFPRSRGVFFGDSPLNFTLPVLVLQTSLVALFTACLQFLLIPLGESSFIPQMLVRCCVAVCFFNVVHSSSSLQPYYVLKLSSLYCTKTSEFVSSIVV